ncbi:acetylornithine aminotransferase [Bacteroidia bacterium]|nr:acetylornithine aminotransferase [Bacteroidia bacterium]
MQPFDVYPLWDIEPVRALGCYLFDKQGVKYLDLYGGHAVISIGHCHPHYVQRIEKQLYTIGFYSNAVQNSLQQQLAQKLGEVAGYQDYALFLCNSGAEANENALKLASFHTGKSKVLAFGKSFHGRTSGAVAATDNAKIISPFNQTDKVVFAPLNDIQFVENQLKTKEFCAVIIESIQGVAGIVPAEIAFLQQLQQICNDYNVVMITDEIQCGYGRTGKFFAHQWAGICPDIITTAKGMGNGFPIGGVLISPKIKPVHGQLGTTFGGNHLACTAALAVLDVFEQANIVQNAFEMGEYLMQQLRKMQHIKELRGRGLMIGIEMEVPIAEMRKKLLFEHHIFTGVSGTHTIRLLPPLCIKKEQADEFLQAFAEVAKKFT